jgi:hypothetical protein
MCISCDLLQGLDLDALSPEQGSVSNPLHWPVSRDGLSPAALFSPPDSAVVRRLRRCPPAVANAHRSVSALTPEALVATALDDFRHFWLARLEGRIQPELRYTVALPTAYTLLCAAGQREDLAQLLAYEQRVVAAVQLLLGTVPPEHLAIQWDAPAEMRVWETRGRDLTAPRGLPERLLQSFVTQWEAVPDSADIGLHLCHATAGSMGSANPTHIGQAVRLVGAVIASTERQPQFVHLPVPPERDDSVYFEDLIHLALWPSLEVHLGLVHESDTPDDVAARLSAAREVLPYAAASADCQTRVATALRLLGADQA